MKKQRFIILLASAFFAFSCSDNADKANNSEENTDVEVVDENEDTEKSEFSAFLPATMEFEEYCNQRFDVCIPYPTFLIPEEESPNGDGRYFTSKDGSTKILFYGSLIMDEINDLNAQYKGISEDEGLLVYMGSKVENVFTFEGRIRDEGKDFFNRTFEKNGEIITFEMIFPSDDFDYYEAYFEEIKTMLQ